MFSSRLLAVVLCILCVEVSCISCSDYEDEATCNFKGTQSCRYTGSACEYASCRYFNDSETICEANNGQLSCKYSTAEKCHNAKCSDYTDNQASCEANDGTLSCKFTAGTPNVCANKYCSSWNPAAFSSPTDAEKAACTAADGKLQCKMEESSTDFWTCTEKDCGDYNDSKTVCESVSDDYGGSCRFVAGADGGPNTCVDARCGDYTDSASCATANGQLECLWSESHTPDKCYSSTLGPCLELYLTDKNGCQGAPAKYNCVWSTFWEMCGTLGCSTFNESQAVCESPHPECHFSGDKCVEGSGASAMGAPTLVILLFAFAAIFVF